MHDTMAGFDDDLEAAADTALLWRMPPSHDGHEFDFDCSDAGVFLQDEMDAAVVSKLSIPAEQMEAFERLAASLPPQPAMSCYASKTVAAFELLRELDPSPGRLEMMPLLLASFVEGEFRPADGWGVAELLRVFWSMRLRMTEEEADLSRYGSLKDIWQAIDRQTRLPSTGAGSPGHLLAGSLQAEAEWVSRQQFIADVMARVPGQVAAPDLATRRKEERRQEAFAAVAAMAPENMFLTLLDGEDGHAVFMPLHVAALKRLARGTRWMEEFQEHLAPLAKTEKAEDACFLTASAIAPFFVVVDGDTHRRWLAWMGGTLPAQKHRQPGMHPFQPFLAEDASPLGRPRETGGIISETALSLLRSLARWNVAQDPRRLLALSEDHILVIPGLADQAVRQNIQALPLFGVPMVSLETSRACLMDTPLALPFLDRDVVRQDRALLDLIAERAEHDTSYLLPDFLGRPYLPFERRLDIGRKNPRALAWVRPVPVDAYGRDDYHRDDVPAGLEEAFKALCRDSIRKNPACLEAMNPEDVTPEMLRVASRARAKQKGSLLPRFRSWLETCMMSRRVLREKLGVRKQEVPAMQPLRERRPQLEELEEILRLQAILHRELEGRRAG